jgi:hypothetical protein
MGVNTSDQLCISDGSVAVGTGNSGVLLLDEVQKEGCNPCKAAELVKSLKERFGRCYDKTRG